MNTDQSAASPKAAYGRSKRHRRTNAQGAHDAMNVLTALQAYGSVTEFTNRDIAEMTGLATHRLQVIITRLARAGSILRHTKTFMTDVGFRRH